MIQIEIDMKHSNMLTTEKSFVYNSWLKSYGKSRESQRMSSKVYFHNYTKIIDGILEDCYVAFALNPDDLDQIFGFVVFNYDEDINLTVIHYIYVKEAFRKLGLAKKLMQQIQPQLGSEPMICTFANHIFDDLREKYLLAYDPFMRGTH
jgi:GNAT superfamily N-acetyltransferase